MYEHIMHNHIELDMDEKLIIIHLSSLG